MLICLAILFLGLTDASFRLDMWELAQENADVLRISTLFTAQQLPRYLSDDDGIERAVLWCKSHGITHVYLESFRTGTVPPKKVLARARDRFRDAGLIVSGCITPAGYGKASTGWRLFSCYTSEQTQRELKAMCEYAAGLFDEVMIDDFLATDCECPDCVAAKGDRSWTEYRCDLMLRLSRTHIIGAGSAVNPNVRFIIKYPCWHEQFQNRGYDVERQSQLFPDIWVGTETRGTEETGPAEPQYRAYWLMRWLLDVGGEKCGGGWHDSIRTDPKYYVEQARQSVLGGAPEVFLFNFGALYEGAAYDRHFGPKDVAALMEEMPLHFQLARLIHGKPPRGLLGWKPTNSAAGADWNLQPLLGMAGFPVTASHRFDPRADGFVFGCHVLHDAGWPAAVKGALESGRPVLVTPAFLEEAAAVGEARGLDVAALKERAIVLPTVSDRNRWEPVEAMSEGELNALRARALDPMGITFQAPARVSLYLFGDDVVVIENFRDESARCELRLEGWAGFEHVLQMPATGAAAVPGGSTGEMLLPPRSLVALQRAG